MFGINGGGWFVVTDDDVTVLLTVECVVDENDGQCFWTYKFNSFCCCWQSVPVFVDVKLIWSTTYEKSSSSSSPSSSSSSSSSLADADKIASATGLNPAGYVGE